MKTLRFTAIVCAALVFGLTLSHVLQSPGSRSLPPGAWLEVQHSFYGGFAILGGTAEIVGALTSVLLAVIAWRAGRRISGTADVKAWGPPALAALALLGTLVAYWIGNRPINAKITYWTVATLPNDWSSYRSMWENAHAASAILSGIAFIALLVPLVWVPHTRAETATVSGE